MLASIINVDHLVTTAGYPLLIVLVMAEAGGVPIPGETALITAAILASQGKFDIVLVIAFAALGAIVGDNIGYLIGRKGGRWLLERPGPFRRQRREVLAVGEIAYELGNSAGSAIKDFGLYGVVAVAIAILSAVVLRRRHVHGLAHTHTAEDAPEAPSGSQDHEPPGADGA